jgi:hypothetical protein
MKRRAFIQTTALTAAGVFSLPILSDAAKIKGKLGLQLYTLRDTIENDPKGVLKKVADYGYKELETYSYRDGKIFGMAFSDFGSYVKDLGMQVCSGHYGLDQATSDSPLPMRRRSVSATWWCLTLWRRTERASMIIKKFVSS